MVIALDEPDSTKDSLSTFVSLDGKDFYGTMPGKGPGFLVKMPQAQPDSPLFKSEMLHVAVILPKDKDLCQRNVNYMSLGGNHGGDLNYPIVEELREVYLENKSQLCFLAFQPGLDNNVYDRGATVSNCYISACNKPVLHET